MRVQAVLALRSMFLTAVERASLGLNGLCSRWANHLRNTMKHISISEFEIRDSTETIQHLCV